MKLVVQRQVIRRDRKCDHHLTLPRQLREPVLLYNTREAQSRPLPSLTDEDGRIAFVVRVCMLPQQLRVCCPVCTRVLMMNHVRVLVEHVHRALKNRDALREHACHFTQRLAVGSRGHLRCASRDYTTGAIEWSGCASHLDVVIVGLIWVHK